MQAHHNLPPDTLPDTPKPRFPATLLAQAKGIGLLLLDVDGVLTDGSLFFGAEGETVKCFNSLDGHGLKLLQRAGIQIAVISGRDSPALRQRLNTLEVAHQALGNEDKLPAAQSILQALRLSWQHCAVMGDDWPDLPLMQRAHLAIAPLNAHGENHAHAHWITRMPGGNGAVREVCDLLLLANDRYSAQLHAYIPPSSP